MQVYKTNIYTSQSLELNKSELLIIGEKYNKLDGLHLTTIAALILEPKVGSSGKVSIIPH